MNIYIEFTQLLQKYAILTSMAVISTIIFLGIHYTTQIGVVILIDNLINSLCVIMMSSWHNRFYYCLCGICHSSVNKCKHNRNNKTHQIVSAATVSQLDINESRPRIESNTSNTSNTILSNNISKSSDPSTASTPNSQSIADGRAMTINLPKVGYKPKLQMVESSSFTIVGVDDDDQEYKRKLAIRRMKHLDTIDLTEMILLRGKLHNPSPVENVPQFDGNHGNHGNNVGGNYKNYNEDESENKIEMTSTQTQISSYMGINTNIEDDEEDDEEYDFDESVNDEDNVGELRFCGNETNQVESEKVYAGIPNLEIVLHDRPSVCDSDLPEVE